MRKTNHCDDCGWMKQAIDTGPLVCFKRDMPLIHCSHCDLLEVMSDPHHKPAWDLAKPPENFR